MSYSRHLAKGMRILGERWVDGPRKWIAAAEGGFDKAVRMALVGGIGYGLWRVLSSSWKTLGITVAIVCLVALRAATKAAKTPQEKPAAATAPAPADDATAADEPVSEDAFRALLADTLGVATGVHLRTLAAALTARHGGGWDVPAVRALCQAHGVPVRPTVRAPGGGPTVGVHRDDLDLLPNHSPSPFQKGHVADYTAGQKTTTTPTTPAPTTPTTPTVTEHGGLRIVAQDDPDNPARTHVTVVDRTRKRTG